MLQEYWQATNAELEAKLTDSVSKFMEALSALQMLEAQDISLITGQRWAHTETRMHTGRHLVSCSEASGKEKDAHIKEKEARTFLNRQWRLSDL